MKTLSRYAPALNHLTLALASTLLLVAYAANATAAEPQHSTNEDSTSAPHDSHHKTTDLDRVVITGSRIPRAGFDTLEPATVVNQQYLDSFGFTNVADALFSQPGFDRGADVRGNQAGFGAGVNFLGRFGLGSNRQLVLVNGRRLVTSNPPTIFGPGGGGTQVDLNVIPTSLIERTETIGVGGAPTYGSDAISGVTNMILKKNYEGAEVKIGYGLTERGDNARYTYSALLGSHFANSRGNLTIALDADDNEGVLGSARRYYRNSYSMQPNPNATAIAQFQPGRDYATDGRVHTTIPFNTSTTDGIPGRVLIRNRRLNNTTLGGLLFPITDRFTRNASGQLLGFGPGQDQFLQFDKQGNLVSYNPGINFGNSSSSGGDGLDLINQAVQVTSQLDRKSVFMLGNYDVTDTITSFFEGSYYSSKALEMTAQSIYNAVGAGIGNVDGSGDQDGTLNFNIDNPFLSEQNRQALRRLGITDFQLSRASRDLVIGNSSTDTRLWRAVAGLNGHFDAGGHLFDWETSINHGEGNFDYYGTGLIQQHFINAINVVRNSAGEIVCNPSAAGTTVDPNCVPLNLFGEGVASAAARNYVTTPTHATAQMKQTVFNANLSGSLIDLPGGKLGFNVGYERRKEEGRFTPDEYQRLGLGRQVPVTGSRGSFTTNEYFAEILAPLVNPEAGLPGLHRLDLTGKLRRVNNTVNGWFTAYTYGLQYEPVQGIQLRGNKTRSFRAPAIVELYTSQQPGYSFISEPCTPADINAGKRPDVRQRNCQAFFGYYSNVDPSTFEEAHQNKLGSVSGNPRLENELAKSWTAGIVFQPDWARGLRMAADWYDIKLSNLITVLSPDDITSGCFDNDTFNTSDVPNANHFCSLITRDPRTGVASSIRREYTNGPYIHFRGWTAEVNYRFDLRHLRWGGLLDLSLNGYFPKNLKYAATLDIPPTESAGTINNSKRQLQWNTRYLTGPWNFGLRANYKSSAVSALTSTVETRDYLGIPSYTSYDANIGYTFDKHSSLNLAVLNVTDKMVAFPYMYDASGRRSTLTVN
ncbi:MAG TPA: TonB-dependent receptor domain-containing protein, partial [Xylella taiwanensis]